MAGKGDTPRKVDKKKYSKNYDAIRWKSKEYERLKGCTCKKKRGVIQCKNIQ